MKYLVTGGGTGGHIYPALAIIEEIKERDKEAEILYVGTEKGMEAEIVPKENINFKTIRVNGMPRSLNKQSFIAMKELMHGLKASKKIIKDFKPDIVIGTGGYVSGPIVYMGAKKGIPTLIHEQNAYPGVTNRILSRYVTRMAITFKEAKDRLNHKERVILTGNPIRKKTINVNSVEAYKNLGIDEKKTFILSFGGSGGQKKLNDSILDLIDKIKDSDIELIHVTGKRLHDDFMNEFKRKDVGANIKILPYLYNMPEALNIADLVITSAGAITLSEISAIGVPTILVPKGYTTENHQEFNARSFEAEGAAKVILEKDISGQLLYENIMEIINDDNLREQMAQNTKKLGKINASEKIYEIIEEII